VPPSPPWLHLCVFVSLFIPRLASCAVLLLVLLFTSPTRWPKPRAA
jgi:hypothetical protein